MFDFIDFIAVPFYLLIYLSNSHFRFDLVPFKFVPCTAGKESCFDNITMAAATMDTEMPLDILGNDVLVKILGFCDVVVLERAKLVNKRFLNSCKKTISQKPCQSTHFPGEGAQKCFGAIHELIQCLKYSYAE